MCALDDGDKVSSVTARAPVPEAFEQTLRAGVSVPAEAATVAEALRIGHALQQNVHHTALLMHASPDGNGNSVSESRTRPAKPRPGLPSVEPSSTINHSKSRNVCARRLSYTRCST